MRILKEASVLLSVGLLAVTSACGSGSGGSDGEEIRIGLVTGITGPASILAPSMTQAAELAVAEINDAGGLLGKKVKLVVADDATDPRVAVDAWNNLVKRDGVDVVVSFETSAGRDAGVPIAEKANVPAIYTSVYEGGACSPVLYLDAEVPNQQISALVDYLGKDKGLSSFYFVGSDYVAPREMNKIAKRMIEDQGGKVVGDDYYPIGTNDWTPVVNKIQKSGAEAVLTTIAGGGDNVALLKQLKAAGVEVPVTSLTVDEITAKAVGPDVAGLLMSGSYFNTLDTPENQKYLDAMQAKFGAKTAIQSFLSTPVYDAVHLYAEGVLAAKSTETKKVLEAMSTASFTGPRGTVTLNADRHATLSIYVAEAQADGTFEILKSFGEIEPSDQCDPNPAFGR